MLYSRLKFTLIICILQMCSFRATGPFEHLANAGPDSVRSIAWESNHRPRTGQSSGETSENLKRTWKDTLVTDSDPSPLESCHVENTMSKKNKQTSVETDMVEITKRRYMTMLDKFDIWESSVSTLKLPDAELSRVELQMQEIRNAVRNLFDKKIYELIGEPYQFQATEALVTGDLAAGVMERWEGMWLNSVANIHKTWEFPDQLKNSLESIQFSRQGIDFLIDFFIELQTLEVITQKRLKDFLNNEDGSRIISSYIYNRFHKPRLDVCKLYLNFNVKLSLLEGPATRKMADLLEVLEADSWKKIEHDYLKNQLLTYLDDPLKKSNTNDHQDTHFKDLITNFLVLTSQENMEISLKTIEDFMKRVIDYLKNEVDQDIAENPHFIETQSLIETKLGHDMISFIMHYCILIEPREPTKSIVESEKETSSEITENKHNSTGIYYDMRAIEGAVRLLSSVYHSIFVRIKEYQNDLDHEPWQPNFLVDKNENRPISIYGEEDQDFEVFDFEELNKFKEAMQSSLPYTNVQESIQKILIQYEKYYKQREFYDYYPLEDLDSKFLCLLKHFEKFSRRIVDYYEAKFEKLVTREKLDGKVEKNKFHTGHFMFAKGFLQF